MSEEKKLFYTIGEVSNLIGLSEQRLRRWESYVAPLIKPYRASPRAHRLYKQEDIALFFKIKELINEGYRLDAIKKKIQSLHLRIKSNKAKRKEVAKFIENKKKNLILKHQLAEIRKILNSPSPLA
jgi:DNA-binding transcriptional MerR regulator